MKHASSKTLDALDSLLDAIRKCPGLREKSRGVFYRKAQAFLHFHEDPTGIFADMRTAAEWQRLPVNAAAERKALMAKIKAATRS